MNGLRHPFSGALYEQTDGGDIRVTDGETEGVFAPDGRWISGELRECDPQLCGWVAGPQLANHRTSPGAGQPEDPHGDKRNDPREDANGDQHGGRREDSARRQAP